MYAGAGVYAGEKHHPGHLLTQQAKHLPPAPCQNEDYVTRQTQVGNKKDKTRPGPRAGNHGNGPWCMTLQHAAACLCQDASGCAPVGGRTGPEASGRVMCERRASVRPVWALYFIVRAAVKVSNSTSGSVNGRRRQRSAALSPGASSQQSRPPRLASTTRVGTTVSTGILCASEPAAAPTNFHCTHPDISAQESRL